jgi:ubiquinone/menaquinone biosynthesis C-methylase UbiE
MEVTEAVALIESGFQDRTRKESWADLGCGSGTFTKALAALLQEGSKIYAVDKESQHFSIQKAPTAAIEFLKLDFMSDTLPFADLDGILMANALHYVKDKPAFIEKLKKHIKGDGQMVIVEYDTEQRNPWVPYPVSYENLMKIFSSCGFNRIEKLGERKSIYRAAKIYACSIKRN